MTRPRKNKARTGPPSINSPEALALIANAEREHIISRRAGGRSGEGRSYRDDRTGAILTPLAQHLLMVGLVVESAGGGPGYTLEPTPAGLAHLRTFLARPVVETLFMVLAGGLPARVRIPELIG